MNFESNALFHEMWHAYKAYLETHAAYQNSLLNLEIEACYAQYLYLNNLPEYRPESKWHDWYEEDDLCRSIARLKEFITPKGNLQSGQTDPSLELHVLNSALPLLRQSGYNRNFNYDNSGSGIFLNLRTLSINC